ncbi:hypothetical protein [Capnocytophaga canimorsus]|uniref:hypothetical protein n=1 Tax=Capnocytophaga canimorsus TaxID=28188 RepID=UPI001EDE348F|nr:hypothetical protein [Capnocytophaga canimorsus]GJQ04712.1 hypothetical protein CAPN009_11270 [Capnocytophaga canimorsus]
MKTTNKIWLFCTIATGVLTGCTRDYTDDMQNVDQKILALNQTDQELRASIEQQFALLRSEIQNKIIAAEQKWDTSIDHAMATSLQQIKANLQQIDAIDEKINQTNTLVIQYKNRMQQTDELLEKTRQAIVQKMNQGDSQIADQLASMKTRIETLQAKRKQGEDLSVVLKNRLNQLHSANHSAVIKQLEERVKILSAYNLNNRMKEVREEMEKFAEQKFETLTTTQMQKVQTTMKTIIDGYNRIWNMYDDIEDRVNNLDQYVTDYESHIEGIIEEVESFANDVIDDFNSLESDFSGEADDLEDKINEVQNIIDTYENYELQVEDKLNDLLGNIPDVDATIEGIYSDLESKLSDAESAVNDLESALEEYKDYLYSQDWD